VNSDWEDSDWEEPTGPSQAVGRPDAVEPLPRRSRRRRLLWVAPAVVTLAVGSVVGVRIATPPATATSQSTSAGSDDQIAPGTGSGRWLPSTQVANASVTASATAAEEVGVVDIDTVLGYAGERAAGTGLVLTSSGEILTNNHVIDGATSIRVTLVSTGRTYSASVVGYDVSADIAVLQLSGASGLATADIASDPAVSVGDSVTGVGNAGGVGGTPSAAAGVVVALRRTITVSEESGGGSMTLAGLIETDAAIQAGDSGGPLYNASDQVVGIDTAASSGGQVEGYAIPIRTALLVAALIESGSASSTVHVGTTAMLGVQVSGTSGSAGAIVRGVLSGSPADDAGLTAGDVITSLAGRPVTSADKLSSILGGLTPGQRVSLSWTDQAGNHHRATVTLMTGPAQ